MTLIPITHAQVIYPHQHNSCNLIRLQYNITVSKHMVKTMDNIVTSDLVGDNVPYVGCLTSW